MTTADVVSMIETRIVHAPDDGANLGEGSIYKALDVFRKSEGADWRPIKWFTQKGEMIVVLIRIATTNESNTCHSSTVP